MSKKFDIFRTCNLLPANGRAIAIGKSYRGDFPTRHNQNWEIAH